MLRTPMRKVQNAKLMGNGGREMEILTKNQKKKKKLEREGEI